MSTGKYLSTTERFVADLAQTVSGTESLFDAAYEVDRIRHFLASDARQLAEALATYADDIERGCHYQTPAATHKVGEMAVHHGRLTASVQAFHALAKATLGFQRAKALLKLLGEAMLSTDSPTTARQE